ncbi:FHA domain-containing protein [Microbacterium sp. STN6]|uniref:FHA domain-containing protein n=1 Tax=Microbacterium sp. STN6 TaxID=2995588 RepID=UPI002260FD7A|nr:FHA domain-containing protein [Microbacterium sp. STN6]MCX7522085.1 FHA domain-containing protein [Microbacterium sp. STN6]
MDKPGFITPPPGLIPSKPKEISETVRLTERRPPLPEFHPAPLRVEEPRSGVSKPTPMPVEEPRSGVSKPTPMPVEEPRSGVSKPTPMRVEEPRSGVSKPTPMPVEEPRSGVSKPSAAPPQFSLVMHDGSVIRVSGTLLLGRDPARVPGWESAGLGRVNDPEKSVSKTHAGLDCSDGVFWITDLDSTNGIAVVDPAGAETVLTPGVRHSVEAGSTVELGRYRIRVYRQ